MVANKREISLSHGGSLRRAELFDRSPITGSHSNRPPVLVGTKRMPSILCPHLLRVYSALPQHVSQALRIADATPGIKCLVQLRSHLQNCLPKRAIRWLKHVRSPGRDRQLPPGRTKCHSSRTALDMSGTKKIPKTHMTASKLSPG